uniref:Uncharacterized protein n=1 Tax=Anguilla anguilla TaxID=7936 RepID=A0A0E9TVN0_ANGAN
MFILSINFTIVGFITLLSLLGLHAAFKCVACQMDILC